MSLEPENSAIEVDEIASLVIFASADSGRMTIEFHAAAEELNSHALTNFELVDAGIVSRVQLWRLVALVAYAP